MAARRLHRFRLTPGVWAALAAACACFCAPSVGLSQDKKPSRPQINLAERFPRLPGIFGPQRPPNDVYDSTQRSLGIKPIDDLLAEPDMLPPQPNALPASGAPPAPPGIPISQLQPPPRQRINRSSPSSISPVPSMEPSDVRIHSIPQEVEGEPVDGMSLMQLPQRLSSFRNGFFQKLSLQATYLGDSDGDQGLPFTEIEGYLTVAIPFPIVEWPMLITPYYQTRLIQGPNVTDVPAQLNDAFVEFMWVPQILNRWLLILAASPGVYSDFQQGSGNNFRITGKALVRYDVVPDKLQALAGVLYLGRENLMLLPVGGVFWTPAEWARYELIFPKPKFAQRFNVGMGFEDWIYFTAEYGGNTYAVRRANDTFDKLTYSDYRLLLGIERKLNGGAGFHVEAGYVLGRDVSFESNQGDFTPADTWLVRGGVVF